MAAAWMEEAVATRTEAGTTSPESVLRTEAGEARKLFDFHQCTALIMISQTNPLKHGIVTFAWRTP